MGRTSDSRTAAANDNYRNNKFWEKKSETLETENELTEQPANSAAGVSGEYGELGRDGSGSGVTDSGDDE